MTPQDFEALNKLLARQRKLKITLGSAFGLILTLYFLTFAALLDKAPPGTFTVMVVTSIPMAIALFTLNPISFALTKRLSNASGRALLAHVNSSTVDKKPEQLEKELLGK